MKKKRANSALRTAGGAGRTVRARSVSARSSSRSKGLTRARNAPIRRREAGGGLIRRVFNRKAFRALLMLSAFLAAGAGAGAGAKAGWSWLTHSSRLAIREVVVNTGDRVSEDEVMTLANLHPGDNILGFSLSACVAGIEIHPWVKSAAVMRQLPDRVLIEVKERRPAAVISVGAFYYVDEDGEVFKKVLPGEDLSYPILTGLTLREVVDDRSEVDSLIKLGLEFIEISGHARSFPRGEISELYLDRSSGITLVRAADGMRICFGFDGFEDKWVRMERALEELGDEAAKVAELDLNYEGRVTIRFREGYRVASAKDPLEQR